MDRRHTSKWISTPSTALEGLEGQHISWMESQTDIVIFAPHLIGYETTIGVRWLAHPNHSCGDFPRNFWSSHKYHVHCQSEEFYESLNDYTIPPPSPPTIMLNVVCVCVCLERLTNCEHVVQSLCTMCWFGVHSCIDTHHSSTCVRFKLDTKLDKSTLCEQRN